MAEDMRDFAEAFGLDYSDPDDSDDSGLEDDDQGSEDQDVDVDDGDSDEGESEGEEGSDDESDDEGSEEDDGKPDKNKSQQNFAFAKLRNENRELNKVLRDVGQILGLDGNTDSDKIIEGVKQAVLQQKAKDQGVPVETLQKIAELENLVEENKRIKLEKETSESFTELIDEFDLSNEQLNEFTNYLIENDLNPLDGKTVDLKAEYLKLHWSEMLEAAKDAAVESEHKRREKVVNHSGGGAPGKKGDVSKQGDYEISTVSELDAFFKKQDL